MYPLNEVPANVLESSYHVVMNGKVLGYVARRDAARVADKMRMLKIRDDDDRVPAVTEIVLIAARPKHPGQYPGLYIFTNPARMMRPVINLAVNKVELIGTLEQVGSCLLKAMLGLL
jgi:DNA-directed RNA polymerase I subunit RPA2